MSEEANKTGDLEITLEDVQTADAGGAVDIQLEQPAKANEEGVEDWKAQLAAAQKKADDAERLAKQRSEELERVQRENSANRTAAVSAEMMAVENAIANAEHERSDAEDEYAQAMEQGDYRAAAKAQSKLSAIAVKAQRIQEGKAALERRAEDVKAQSERSADPIEQYTQGMTAASANWVRAHSDLFLNETDRSFVIAAHHRAVRNNIALDTPEYFEAIERELGLRSDDTHHQPTEQRQTRTVVPAAPVSRGGAAEAPRTSQNTVRLTAAEREIAAACGMTDAEYAKNKVALQREGKTTH